MRTYTLHLPDGAEPGDPEALEEAVLVRDGFSGAAFAFSVVWFLVHRLWLAALLVLAGLVALQLVLALAGAGSFTRFLAGLLFAFLVGLEANSLRRWTLERAGRPAVDLVRAADRDEAETKAFGRWLGEGGSGQRTAPDKAAARSLPPHRASRAEPVIGLFPEAERR